MHSLFKVMDQLLATVHKDKVEKSCNSELSVLKCRHLAVGLVLGLDMVRKPIVGQQPGAGRVANCNGPAIESVPLVL